MNRVQPASPQQTVLFRIVAFFTRLQVSYLLKSASNSRTVLIGFAVLAGSTTLGTIAATAFLIDLPLLFPPLAASAFILFYVPMSELASPRNVLLSHTISVLSGMFARWLILSVSTGAGAADPLSTSWPHVGAIAMAMALSSVLMICLRCPHPPAAATATIAAMGFFAGVLQLIGLGVALVLVVLEAFFFNRVLGGLPYPLWRSDPRVASQYGSLAGIPDASASPWQRLSTQLFRRR